MSPTCAETRASLPSVRQNVFFSSPPTASTGGPRTPSVDRQRRVPPGAADRQLAPVHHAHHGVVARHVDRAVVRRARRRRARAAVPRRRRPSKQMGSSERLALVITSGADVGLAAAGGAPACTAAARPATGCPGRRPSASAAPGRRRSSTIGRAGEVSTAASASSISASARAGVEVAHHHRERLVAAVLARRAAARRPPRTSASTGEVVAAEPLDRDDHARASGAQPRPRRRLAPGPRGDARRSRGAAASSQSAARSGRSRGSTPAGRGSGGRPGRRYSARAGRAHREARHRRGRAVVGQPGDDREPRTAVRARDERVAEPAVGRVEQLAQAVGAQSRRRADERDARPAAAGHDREPAVATERAALARPRRRSARAAGPAPRAGRRTRPPRRRRPAPRRTPRRPRCRRNRKGRSSAATRWTKGRKPTPCTTPVTV